METLYIRIGAPAREEAGRRILEDLDWLVLDGEGQVINQGRGDGEALASLIGEPLRSEPERVVAVIPGEYCLSLQVQVPGRNNAQIRRALPFAVEEYLASELEATHLAHGPIRRGAPIDCLAVERALIEGWLEALTTAGITPGTMLCESELLPRESQAVGLFFDDDGRVLIRLPRQSLVAERDTLALTLASALEQLGPEPLRVRCTNGELAELERAELEQSAPMALDWERADTDTAGFIALARGWQAQPEAINLLQGELAPVSRASADWYRWRSVAALAGVWFVVALSAQAGQALWADSRAGALEAEIRARYQTHFRDDPRADTRPIVTLHSHMAQQIRADAGHSGFLALTGELADALASDNGARVRSMSYHETRMELSLDLMLSDTDALDHLQEALTASGLSVEIGSYEPRDEGIRARMRLRG